MNKDNDILRNDLVWETIFGVCPSKSNNYEVSGFDSNGFRHMFKSERMREYEKTFAAQCHIYKNRMISRPFIFHLVAYYPTWAYDLDGSFKGILDNLQYCRAISNDNNAIRILAEKRIDRNNPRIMFAIQEVEPTLF